MITFMAVFQSCCDRYAAAQVTGSYGCEQSACSVQVWYKTRTNPAFHSEDSADQYKPQVHPFLSYFTAVFIAFLLFCSILKTPNLKLNLFQSKDIYFRILYIIVIKHNSSSDKYLKCLTLITLDISASTQLVSNIFIFCLFEL